MTNQLPRPADGPRYHREDTSAALLRSAFRPAPDRNIPCPDCRQLFISMEGAAKHWTAAHDRGRFVSCDPQTPAESRP